MYDQSSALIASVLFACILLSIEAGFRVGRRRSAGLAEALKSQVNSIQAAVLGVLALLLGFTFSLALQRYDSRTQAVVDEANAIGTAYLRSQLLPASMRDDVSALLRDYLKVRIQAASVNILDTDARDPLLQQTNRMTAQLWRYAVQAAAEDGRSVASGLFIQSLNDVFDAYGKRNAALNRHVPELVFLLLFVTFLMAGSILGYASGIERTRAILPMIMMVAIMTLVVFLIVDLDRPRRGLIRVSQHSLVQLQQSMQAKGQR